MNSYDAEMHILRQKDMARRAAEDYALKTNHIPTPSTAIRLPIYRRTLAAIGGRLVSMGYRLQGEIDQLATSAELTDALGLKSNSPCVEC